MSKAAIMGCAELLERLRAYIAGSETEDEVRLAAIWSAINLTWPDDELSEERVIALRAAGFETALRQAVSLLTKRQQQHVQASAGAASVAPASNFRIDLNDRAALALEHFTEFFRH